MAYNQIRMTIEQIGIGLTLLLTILGWGVTAYYQRRLLERQIQADREKEARQLITPRKVQQLDTIKKWLEDGHRLWQLRQGLNYLELKYDELIVKRKEIDKQIEEWSSQHYASISPLARLVDEPDSEDPPEERQKNLGWMISRIFMSMPTVNLAYDDDPRQSEVALQMFLDYYEPSIRKIESLIDKTIKGREE